MNKLLMLGIVAFLSLQSCYYDNEEELYPQAGNCDTTAVTYSGTVSKILNQRCAISGCHLGASGQAIGIFDTHANTKTYLDAGNTVRLLDAINHRNGRSPMPKGSATKLDACDLLKIEAWINSGYPNN